MAIAHSSCGIKKKTKVVKMLLIVACMMNIDEKRIMAIFGNVSASTNYLCGNYALIILPLVSFFFF